MWELSNTVWFSPSFLIKSLISIICFGSSPTIGSSNITLSGLPRIACASPTLCRYPFDKFFISLSDTSKSPVSSIASKIYFSFNFLSSFFNPATKSIYSLTVISRYKGGISGKYPICSLAFLGFDIISKPSTFISPLVAPKYPVTMFIVDDFPAPFAPSSPYILPFSSLRLNLSTATCSPYFFTKLLISIKVMASLKL